MFDVGKPVFNDDDIVDVMLIFKGEAEKSKITPNYFKNQFRIINHTSNTNSYFIL